MGRDTFQKKKNTKNTKNLRTEMKGINKGPLAKGEREETHHTQQIRTGVKSVNRRHQQNAALRLLIIT